MMIIVNSIASKTPKLTTIAVFAFVQTISFKAPLMRVKVEPLVAVPMAIHSIAQPTDNVLTPLQIY